jgi:predicted nucleotidyltransferase
MMVEIDSKLIADYLRERVGAYLVILFGSHSKGMARGDSDIDIAYLSDTQLGSYEIFLVAQELANQVGCEVDLLDLKVASTVMKAQVISSGQVIYCIDEVRRMYFYMRSLKEYAMLNEERAVILQDIIRRGSVYGQ